MPIVGESFDLGAQGVVLQYIALIIGSVQGEQLGGPISDLFLNHHSRRTSHNKPTH